MEQDFRSEKEFLKSAAGGDQDIFNFLVRTHASRVFTLACRLTTDERTARALTFAAFIEAYGSLPDFDQRTSFATFLVRLAVTVWKESSEGKLMRLYRKKFHGAKATAPEKDRLLSALAAMGRRERLIFVLWEMEKMSYAQLIELTGIDEHNLERHITRAREAFIVQYKKAGLQK